MDFLEFLVYFFAFWLFLFNRKFRDYIVNEWQSSGIWGRAEIIIEAVCSIACSVFAPAWLLWEILIKG